MNDFEIAFSEKMAQCQSNNFGIDNFDEKRFGKYSHSLETKVKFIQAIKKVIGYKYWKRNKQKETDFLNKYGEGLQNIYAHLDKECKELLVELIAYRRLGFRKVKLSRNNKDYLSAVALADSLADKKDTFDPHYMNLILVKFDLDAIGFDVKLYFSVLGIAIDFLIEQYAYKSGDKTIVGVEKGDVVIDAGACWGDTALYFAHKSGDQGKVYSFEFIPDNIKLFNLNKSFNPKLANQINLVEHPVSNKSGDKIYFKDNGPASRVQLQPFDGQTGFAALLRIDDFVKQNNISKVDFIKMDIEGAEPLALQGAIETIKKFRPKLAIAIYHSINDFVNIPNWILGLNLDYEIFLGHYTIHAEETICFAKPRNK